MELDFHKARHPLVSDVLIPCRDSLFMELSASRSCQTIQEWVLIPCRDSLFMEPCGVAGIRIILDCFNPL